MAPLCRSSSVIDPGCGRCSSCDFVSVKWSLLASFTPERALSVAWLLGVWGVGVFSSLTEWQRLYGKRNRRSPVGEESVHAERGDTSSGFCCMWCLNNSCMHCFLLAELSLPSIPGLFSIISIIWHFIYRLDFRGWDSIIKRVRSIRMNMVFLLLFQTYRFPKIQQGTGNQGVLCITMHHLLPPPLKESIFFPGHAFFLQ